MSQLIMIIDDEAGMRDLLGDALKLAGFETVTAADAMIAQAKLDAQTAAAQEIDKARVAFEQEKVAAVSAIRKEAASLSLELAEKVLKNQLKDKSAQEKLVSDWIAEVKL